MCNKIRLNINHIPAFILFTALLINKVILSQNEVEEIQPQFYWRNPTLQVFNKCHLYSTSLVTYFGWI